MKLLKTSCLAAGASLLAVSAFAGTQAGNLELEGAASLQYQGVHASGQNANNTLYQGQIGVGYFITDAVELKINGVFQGSDQSAQGTSFDNYNIFILAGVDYHFYTKERFVPYVGLYGGGAFGQSSGSGFSNTQVGGVIDAHVGMKQFVGERTSIDYRVSYQYISQSDSNSGGSDSGTSISAIVLTLGVTYQF